MVIEDIGILVKNNVTKHSRTAEEEIAHTVAREDPSEQTNLLKYKEKLLSYEAKLLEDRLKILAVQNGEPVPEGTTPEKLQQNYEKNLKNLASAKKDYHKQIVLIQTHHDETANRNELNEQRNKLNEITEAIPEKAQELEAAQKELDRLVAASTEENPIETASQKWQKVYQPLADLQQNLKQTGKDIRKYQEQLENKPGDTTLQQNIARLEKRKEADEQALKPDSPIPMAVAELETDPLIHALVERDRRKAELDGLKQDENTCKLEIALRERRLEQAKARTDAIQKEQAEATATYEAFEAVLNQDDPEKLQAALTEIQKRKEATHDLYNVAETDLSLQTAKYDTRRAKSRSNVQQAIDEEDAKLAKGRMSASQLTNQIRQTVPGYQPDLSEEAQKKRTELHEKAKKSLNDTLQYVYSDDDPYVAASHKVWIAGREAFDFGPYIALFMDQAAKDELMALAKMVDDNKSSSPDFTARREKLHLSLCRHATGIARETLKKQREMSVEEQVEHYREIYVFSRIGDVTNILPNDGRGLTPQEFHDYYEQLDPALSMGAEVNGVVQFLASDFGDKIDYQQLLGLTTEQQAKILEDAGNGPVVTDSSSNYQPTGLVDWIASEQFICAQGQLAQSDEYPEFHRPYLDHCSGKNLYQDGFNEKFNYQTLDGIPLKDDEARAEIYQNKRPILISSMNDPKAEPVMMHIRDGKGIFGLEAAKAFREQQAASEKIPEPKPVERKYVNAPVNSFAKGIAWAWNWFCNGLEKLPFVNNLDPVRTKWMIERNKEMKSFDAQQKAYEENLAKYKQNQEKNRELVQKGGTLNRLENKAKIRRDMTVLNYAKSLNRDKELRPDDQRFLEDLNKTNLDVTQKMDLIQMRSLIRDERTKLAEQFQNALNENNGSLSTDVRNRYVAAAIQNQRLETRLLGEVAELAQNGKREYNATLLGIPTGADRPLNREALKDHILATFEKKHERMSFGGALTVPRTENDIRKMLLDGTPEQQRDFTLYAERQFNNDAHFNSLHGDVEGTSYSNTTTTLYKTLNAQKRALSDEFKAALESGTEVNGREYVTKAVLYNQLSSQLEKELGEFHHSISVDKPRTKFSSNLAYLLDDEKNMQEKLKILSDVMSNGKTMKSCNPTLDDAKKMLSDGTVGDRRNAVNAYLKTAEENGFQKELNATIANPKALEDKKAAYKMVRSVLSERQKKLSEKVSKALKDNMAPEEAQDEYRQLAAEALAYQKISESLDRGQINSLEPTLYDPDDLRPNIVERQINNYLFVNSGGAVINATHVDAQELQGMVSGSLEEQKAAFQKLNAKMNEVQAAKAKAEAEAAEAKERERAKAVDLSTFAKSLEAEKAEFTFKKQYVKDLSNSPLSLDDQKNLYLLNRVVKKEMDDLDTAYKAATENGKELTDDQCREFAAKAVKYNLVGSSVFRNIENLVSGEEKKVYNDLAKKFLSVDNPDTQKYENHSPDIRKRLANIDGNLQNEIQEMMKSPAMKAAPKPEVVKQMIDAVTNGTANDREALAKFTKDIDWVNKQAEKEEAELAKKMNLTKNTATKQGKAFSNP